MPIQSQLSKLVADHPGVGDFDVDEHEDICGGSDALQTLRARQETIGDAWGHDPECKAIVFFLRKARRKADRKASREDWIKNNPEAYEAEQQLLRR